MIIMRINIGHKFGVDIRLYPFLLDLVKMTIKKKLNQKLKKLPWKFEILLNIQYQALFDKGLSSQYFETLSFLFVTQECSYVLPE